MKPACLTFCLLLILLCRHGTPGEHLFALMAWAVTVMLIVKSR